MTDRDDLNRLKDALADRVIELGEALFGTPSTRNARELRWGTKGSTRISLKGKSPSFFSFEAGTGGSLIDAIVFANACSFAEAVEWARRWLGEDDRPAPRRPKPKPIDVDAEVERRIADARCMFAEAKPITGTPSEVYLRSRAIEAASWPAEVLRHHPRLGLIVAATTAAGTINAVQRIELEADGAPRRDADGAKVKRTRGALAGTAARLPAHQVVNPTTDDLLILAEGPETALSIWYATGAEVWANLGSIAKAPLASVPKSKTIVVALDDDPADAPSRKSVRDAIRTWRLEGRRVVVATPWRLSRGDRTDFNDALQAEGPEAVRERILAAVGTDQPPRPTKPSIHEARRHVAEIIGREVAELSRWVAPAEDSLQAPPFRVVKVGLGIGKTEEGLRAVKRAIAQGKRVVWSVPTHVLGAEAEKRMLALAAGIKSAVYRGREAIDPATGEPMCRDLELVREAEAAMADVEATACAVCEHAKACPYLDQRKKVDVDLWIAPHALLWHARPKIMNGADLLVIDESIALGGIKGTEGRQLLVGLEDLDRAPASPTGAAQTADLIVELMPVRRKLLAAIERNGLGWLRRDALIEVGLTTDEVREARTLEWTAKIQVTIGETKTRSGLREKLKAAAGNRLIGRLALAWRSVAAVLEDADAKASGRLQVVEATDEKTGAAYLALRLFDVAEIGSGWSAMPALLLDATADLTIIKARIPRAQLVAEIDAEAPHQEVVQVVGATFSKSALRDRKGLASDAWIWARRRAQDAGGKWLIVCNQALEEDLRAQGPLPPDVELGHFNGLRGVDRYRDVRGIVGVGRPQPGVADAERLAGILSGRAVEAIGGRFPTRATTLQGRDGSAATVEAPEHPDPLVEAVRRQVCQAELLQIIGRGRGVSRSEDDPVTVYLLGNEPTGLDLARVEQWQAPGPDDRMLAEHGVALATSADAVAAGLAASAEAVKKGRQRSGTFSYKHSLYETVPNLARSRYRRPGPGRSWAVAVYDPRQVPDIGAWLAARLGPVQLEAVVSETDDQVVEVSRPVEAPRPETRPIQEPVETCLPPAPPPHPGGLLDPSRIDLVRGAIRSSGAKAGDVARQAGVSLPTLSNALSRRFGLSPAAWHRLEAAALALGRRQPDIFIQERGPS